LTLEFNISDHTNQSNTSIDQLTVEENTEKDNIIADDLQICDDIVLDVQENKKRSPKTWKKNLNKKLRMEGKPYLGYRRTNEKKIYHDVDRAAKQMGLTCNNKICEKFSKRMCNTFSEND